MFSDYSDFFFLLPLSDYLSWFRNMSQLSEKYYTYTINQIFNYIIHNYESIIPNTGKTNAKREETSPYSQSQWIEHQPHHTHINRKSNS